MRRMESDMLTKPKLDSVGVYMLFVHIDQRFAVNL